MADPSGRFDKDSRIDKTGRDKDPNGFTSKLLRIVQLKIFQLKIFQKHEWKMLV